VHKYVHTNLSAAHRCFPTCHIDFYAMGNNQSQNQSPNPIQKLPRKIAGKFPTSSQRGSPKDSGYQSGSASSTGTAAKGVRTTDPAGVTVASAGSEPPSTPRAEPAPDTAEGPRDAPALPTRSAEIVCRNDSIYSINPTLIILFLRLMHAPYLRLATETSIKDAKCPTHCPVSGKFLFSN
jgi:hypothetical protein